MGREKKTIGSIGEDIACGYLIKKGFKITGRNISLKCGEIDIVAKSSGTTIFCEVKTRSSSSLGPPYLAITRKKTRHIIRNALVYLRRSGQLEAPGRIDVVSINIDADYNPLKIEHFEDAIRGDDFYR